MMMMLWPWLAMFALFFVPTSGNSRNNLSCYQCRVEDNSLCTEQDLKPCGDDQAYDVCMTIIKKSVATGVDIIKKCALDRCTMDPAQTMSLGLNNCDRSREEYECVSCCKESGCNKDAGVSLTSSLVLVTFLSLVLHL